MVVCALDTSLAWFMEFKAMEPMVVAAPTVATRAPAPSKVPPDSTPPAIIPAMARVCICWSKMSSDTFSSNRVHIPMP